MMKAVREDAPKAILLSLIGTILVILITFRFRKTSLAALSSLLLGVLTLGAFLYFKQLKLNFLNFVALPITIGVGADYAVNIMRRFEIEGDSNIRAVVVETGGAVILCSLTTMLGYMALMFSINEAIVGFGLAAGVGEVTTLLTAVLVIPSAITWRKRRRQALSRV
jgi:hypothetical protein